MALLDVRDLKIAFYDTTPPTEVVKGISFSLEEGETGSDHRRTDCRGTADS